MKLLSDTSDEARQRLIEHWRNADDQERWDAIGRLNGALLALAQDRQDEWYPEATPEERRLRLASLWVDRETMIRLFDWDPDERGR